MVVTNHQLILKNSKKHKSLRVVDDSFTFDKAINQQRVNIVASGPSIKQIDLSSILNEPVIFVNGSISLLESMGFARPIAYVISDPRFIRHNLTIISQYYHGEFPLYITQAVAEQLDKDAPEFLTNFQTRIFIIFAVDRPLHSSSNLFTKLSHKLLAKSKLEAYKYSPYHCIQNNIGVSLDIRYGFVEAGTVAFVAIQLAYSLGFLELHLYGIDLLNSQAPRFYENSQNAAPSKLDAAVSNRIVPSLDWAAETYQHRGVLVYNHSPVSKDLFRHLSYQP